MQIATETERKYDVPEAFELPALTGVGGVARVDPAEIHELDATYFDTDDLLLARRRRTLRRRTGGSDAGWHLKTPGDGSSRTEHRLPLDVDGDHDVVPAELLAEVRAIIRRRPLRPVARLRTRRVEAPLVDAAGRVLALLAQDEVRAETDGVEQRWTEIEVELVDGGPKALRGVEKLLLKAGARPAGGPSKLARALGGRLTADAPGPAGGSGPVLGYASEQRDAIVANDPGVRRGDAEAVHRMRVATRRLRSTLRTFKGQWAPEQAGFVSAELKWLADLLGGVRDGQVLTARLTAAANEAGSEVTGVATRLAAHLGAQVEAGRAALGVALDGTRYLRLLDELDALADTDRRPGRPKRVRGRARKSLAKADALLAVVRPGAGRDEQLHDARKAYKRARYAVEVFVPTVGGPAKRLTKRLTDLQDVLGTHQDTVVARELLKDLAGRAHADGENGFGYGVLYARQQRAGEETLLDLPAARAAAGKRGLRSWLG
jgi:CHAD domain-containing protein